MSFETQSRANLENRIEEIEDEIESLEEERSEIEHALDRNRVEDNGEIAVGYECACCNEKPAPGAFSLCSGCADKTRRLLGMGLTPEKVCAGSSDRRLRISVLNIGAAEILKANKLERAQ